MIEQEIQIDFGRCLRAMWCGWWKILIFTVLGVLAGEVLLMGVGSSTYSATSTVYSGSGSTYVVGGYANIANSRTICETAVKNLNIEGLTTSKLQKSLTVTYDDTSMIIGITCNASGGKTSIAAVNAVADSFVSNMEKMVPGADIRLLDTATEATEVSRKSWIIYGALGGFMLSAIIILIGEIFSTRARSLQLCSLDNELQILGIIPVEQSGSDI